MRVHSTWTTSRRIVEVAGISYLAIPICDVDRIRQLNQRDCSALRNLRIDGGSDAEPAVLYIASSVDELRPSAIKRAFEQWILTDDVLQPIFLQRLVLVINADMGDVNPDVEASLIEALSLRSCHLVRIESSQTAELPSGPVSLDADGMCLACRLFDDKQNAFVAALTPHSQPSFENLRLSGQYYGSLSVAVPSRIGSPYRERKALEGLRFAVKDVFELAAMKTTAGCRAWYEYYGPAEHTAPAIRKLLQNGANLIGTVKLGSLITREEPTESADYAAPFNPRGDGYQSAWSSSGGSGAAIASYDWLDFTLATDTTGSSRRPAMANGIFQIRLSQGLLPMEGVIPSWKYFDSLAMFTRDLCKLEEWIGIWINRPRSSYRQLPVSLVYLTDFFPIQNPVQMRLIEDFLADAEEAHDIKIERVSLENAWKHSPPPEAQNVDLRTYLQDVGVQSFCYGVYHELEQFREGYKSRFHKDPYINPVMRWRWEAAKSVSQEQHKDAMDRLQIYKSWFLRNIMQVGKRHTILPLPITSQDVDCRDEPPASPSAPDAFDAIWLAPILGSPEVTIPIGEMPYASKVTGNEEFLPVAISLLGEPGVDMALLDFARCTLEACGRKTVVTTGQKLGF